MLAHYSIPDRPVFRITVPSSPQTPVRVTYLEGPPEQFHRVSTAFLDPVTGEVLRIDRMAARPSGDSVLAWFSALHFGIFGGVAARILWSALGLTLPVLSLTGLRMWWRRISISR
jgi:uncharacterized iron-regulated membrane protein